MRMRGRMGLTLPFLQRSPGGRDVATSTRKPLPWNCSFLPWSPLFIHWAERQVPILLQDHFSLKVCKDSSKIATPFLFLGLGQDSYTFSISWALIRRGQKPEKRTQLFLSSFSLKFEGQSSVWKDRAVSPNPSQDKSHFRLFKHRPGFDGLCHKHLICWSWSLPTFWHLTNAKLFGSARMEIWGDTQTENDTHVLSHSEMWIQI